MSERVKEKTIGKHRYRVALFGARQGQRMLTKLTKKAAPVLGALAEAGTLSGAGLGKAAEALGAQLSEEDFDSIAAEFADVTDVKVGDKWPRLSHVYDEHFAGNYAELLEWLKFAIEANYSDFLGRVANIVSAQSPDK